MTARHPSIRTMTGMLTDSPKPPTPECSISQIGPCAGCGHPTHRYGHGGNPLCVLCRTVVEAGRTDRGKAAPVRP